MTIYGQVIWITGLSGAGKTNLGKKLTSKLRRQSKYIIMLDGDEFRNIFGAEELNQ